MQKLELIAEWDFMHWHKQGMRGSGVLRQWLGKLYKKVHCSVCFPLQREKDEQEYASS